MNAMQLNYWLKQHWKLLLIIIVAVTLLGETIFQIVYPPNRLIPGAKVDGYAVGGMKKDDAAAALDKTYGELKLAIYFGQNDAAFLTPKMKEVGIGVNDSDRLSSMTYPFYLRIIPGSIWWAGALEKPAAISYTYDTNKIANYTQSKVGNDCNVPVQNASLKLVDSQLQVIPSSAGGTCDITQFQQALAQVKPNSNPNSSANTVRIAIDATPAPITDDMARQLASMLNTRLAVPMPMSVDSATDTIPGRVVLSWLDFKAVVPQNSIDNTGNQAASLQFAVNADRMKAYLDQGIAAKLIVKPGVSRVTTQDFTVTSQTNGANGRDIDITKTTQSVVDYINSKNQQAVGVTQVVGPTVVYTRNYSPTSVGFSALLAQYAQDNPGTWGLAFAEMSGSNHLRSATYNANARITAGGIHALYLGYTDVIQQYNGASRPVDIISGTNNASQCFALMFEQSNQACIKGFYNFYGYATITARGRDLGLQNTVFAGDGTVTSAGDIQNTMVGLYKNQIARAEGGIKIINSIGRNTSGSGIPDGTSYRIGHIIGETDTVHNDTAIVYDNSHGTYILTILSDGSSWDKVAGLEQKINALKAVKQPPNAT
jgi:beta-lactamase class A